MRLSPGTRIGPYEIASALGAGGMGEVYRAHDARLNRDVAIKVLPASFASDPERLQRFELEAKAVGQLSHPNVLTVFDVGSIDGAPYLVTELLEGETLRDRLTSAPAQTSPASQKALGVRKALDVGRQVALGLAAAHGAGIVHRDLKPENIFLTRDGRVKILDFGLARMAEPAGAGTAAPTALQMTNPGTVLGTIGYMAPEQVRGKPADTRSDLFALGAVLFEVVAGRRPFDRDSSADTMSAILKEDPPDLIASGIVIPPALDRVVRRCLEKNPDERFQSARDLAFAIEAVEGSSPGATISGATAAIDSARTGRSGLPIAAAVAGIAIVAAAAGYFAGRGGVPAGNTGRVTAARFVIKQLTFGVDDLRMPSVSADGSIFSFVKATTAGNDDIYVQRVAGENAINLTKDSPASDYQPSFSPDGQRIAFRSDRPPGGIFVMGATGESVHRLTDEGFNPAWSPDGREIAFSTASIVDPSGRTVMGSIWRVNVQTGVKTKVTDSDAVQPAWSPDGKFLVFWGLEGASGRRCIFTVSSAGGTRTKLIDDEWMNWNPIWSKDGAHLYYLTDREPPTNVWRMPIDSATGAARGPAERLTLAAADHTWLSRSATGALVAAVVNNRSKVERHPFSLATGSFGQAQTILETTRALSTASPSPDGRWLAFTVTDTSEDVIVMRPDGTGVVRVTNDAYRDRAVSWSADSSTLYFGSNRSGQYEIWRVSADGGGLEPVTRRKDGAAVVQPAVSADGRHLALFAVTPTRRPALVDLTQPIDGRVLRDLVPPEVPVPVRHIGWLKDGRLVAGSIAGGNASTLVLYNPVSKAVTTVPTPGIQLAAIAADRYILGGADDGRVRIIDLTTGSIRSGARFDRNASAISADGTAVYSTSFTTVANVWMLVPADK